MNRQNIITYSVAIIALAVVFLLLYSMTSRVEKKLAFIVDSVELSQRESLTVGKNSDIAFNRVPHDFLTITQEGDRFSWEVNPEYNDSLQYYKINNANPNCHDILNDTGQVISLTLFNSNDEAIPFECTGADVWRTWKKFSKQQDVLARHFATFYHFGQVTDCSHEDSLLWLNQMQQHAVRSFFENKGGKIVMVILDKNTKIKYSDGTTEDYCREGNTSTDGGKAHCCKVQFFDVSDHCYKEPEPEDGYFQIDGVNYVMKTSVKLTEWGAGHVMVKSAKNTLTMHYPRPITIVATVDTLREKSRASSGLITLKQNNNSFPTKSDLYLPTFSNAINFDLCNLEFNFDNDTVKVRDNNFKTTAIHDNAFSLNNLKSSFFPTLAKLDLHSGNDVLKCRIGYITQHFIRSYLFLPLGVLIVLLCLVWWPWGLRRSPLRPVHGNIYNPEQVRHYRLFLTLLLLTSLAYCICKSLIALKLSYTFPYFEKITGIIPASTSLMMLLFFSMAMVLNINFTKQRPIANSINMGVCALLFVGIWYGFFNLIDPAISQGMKDSYFESEITISSYPWEWPKKVGINDTHRSVVYSLIFVEALMLVLWLSLSLWSTRKIRKTFDLFASLHPFTDKLKDCLANLVRPLAVPLRVVLIIVTWAIVALVCYRINWARLWSLSIGGKVVLVLLVAALAALLLSFFFSFVYEAFCKTLKLLFPWHFLLLIVLAVMGKALGNFGTAFITLLVIFGLSRALSDVVKTVNRSIRSNVVVHRHRVLCQMFMVTLFYIVGAMVGDNGYLTNYLGFFLCVFVFFFIVERPDENETNESEKESHRERLWIPILMGTLATYIVALPLLCSILFNPEKVDYSRMTRRLMLYSNFDDLQKSGYRYCESDAEFMVIMSHYMQQQQTQDPLSNDTHFMHASVSSGQSPVVLNDLSVPIAFFGSYGIKDTTVIYFLLLALLTLLVLAYSLGYTNDDSFVYENDFSTKLTNAMQWRLLALFMWVGTSLYIYFSYIDWLPFTGRLNPGLGVDAVGEALETAFLLAFMAAVTYKEEE